MQHQILSRLCKRHGRRSENEITDLLETVGAGNWHVPMRTATAKMIGHGWTDTAIRLACAQYCDGGYDDPHLTALIDGARAKFDQEEAEADAEAIAASMVPIKPLIVSSANFLAGFVPPDYLWDGILQRRFIYSMTGPTGCGKTAVALTIAAHVAMGAKSVMRSSSKAACYISLAKTPMTSGCAGWRLQRKWGSTRPPLTFISWLARPSYRNSPPAFVTRSRSSAR